MLTSKELNKRGADNLPGHLGIVIAHVSDSEVSGEFLVKNSLMAPTGFLHAGSIVSLADTCAGYGCAVNLPEDASGFTTIEIKANQLGTARQGTIECTANLMHIGKTTRVWDAEVTHRESGKILALFRCTHMILDSNQRSKT